MIFKTATVSQKIQLSFQGNHVIDICAIFGTFLIACHFPSKAGNASFNNALNTFYLWLYEVRHMLW